MAWPYVVLLAVVGERDDDARSAKKKNGKSRKKSERAVASGLACTFVFGALWIITGEWFWIFPLAFAGLTPSIRGLLALRRARAADARQLPSTTDSEHEVLRIARAQGGRVTPSVVAVESLLSLAEAEQVLDRMARGGHATVAVAEDGRVEYEFREFLPPAARS